MKRKFLFLIVFLLLIANSLFCGSSTIQDESTSAPTKLATRSSIEIPEPTDTPPPSNTPQPIPTPSPEPTQGPALSLVTAIDYTDDIGWDHIIGVVENISDQPLEFVEIIATLYDDGNNVVGTGFTYTDLDVLLPGERSPFNIADDKWGNWTSYNLQFQSDIARKTPNRNLIARNHRSYVDDIGWFHVEGEVENMGGEPAEFVMIVVTLYNASGEIAGTMFTYTDLDTVPPGGTSPFDAVTDYHFNATSYEIVVEAD